MWIDFFIFFPDRRVGLPPAGVEERWIVTEDGRQLYAWYVPARGAGPVLLWSHGNAGNIDSRREVLLALAELATRRRCAAVIAVSTFTWLADVARRHYGPLESIAGNRFDSLGRISRVSAPILVAHGDQDDIVPFDLGERLFAAALGPKRFFRVSGADHNDTLGRAVLLDAIARMAVAGRRRGM